MLIRKAGRSDGSGLVELLKAADDAAHVRTNAEAVGAALDAVGAECVFVAEIAERLVGFASVQITTSFAYTRPAAELTNLFVLPDFRCGGVGSRLLSAVIAHSESRQSLEIFARVNESNIGAAKLYESMGLSRAAHDEYRLKWY